MPAQFLIERRLDYYSYTFITDDDCILFFSRLYASLSDCKRGIAMLRDQVSLSRSIVKLQTGDDYTFCILNKKGELLGHSVVFFAASSRDYGIRKIVHQSGQARVKESTGSVRADEVAR